MTIYELVSALLPYDLDTHVAIETADGEHYLGDIINVSVEDNVVWLQTDEFGTKHDLDETTMNRELAQS